MFLASAAYQECTRPDLPWTIVECLGHSSLEPLGFVFVGLLTDLPVESTAFVLSKSFKMELAFSFS